MTGDERVKKRTVTDDLAQRIEGLSKVVNNYDHKFQKEMKNEEN